MFGKMSYETLHEPWQDQYAPKIDSCHQHIALGLMAGWTGGHVWDASISLCCTKTGPCIPGMLLDLPQGCQGWSKDHSQLPGQSTAVTMIGWIPRRRTRPGGFPRSCGNAVIVFRCHHGRSSVQSTRASTMDLCRVYLTEGH